MAGTGRSFIGTWEVIGYAYINGGHSENISLKGVQFRLDESGDVIWTITEELKGVPLFSCETYVITLHTNAVIRFGTYAGHVIKFESNKIEPGETMVITCHAWCMMQCKRIKEESSEYLHTTAFSLLPALEGSFFGNIKISAANNKEFAVHSNIVELLGSDIPWQLQPPPFTGLPEEVLGTVLHYLYAECLPDSLSEATAKQVIVVGAQYQSLSKLVSMCQVFMKNMDLKQQIIGLIKDMHSCANKMIGYFTIPNHHSPTEMIGANLCFVVKQSVRDAAVVCAKLLLLCDLFAKCKNELTREERHEIIRYAKSRLPIFMTQLQQFLQVAKVTFSSMSALQRNEVAACLVPEIEVVLDTVSILIPEVQKAIHQIIQIWSPHDEGRRKSSIGDMLGKSLRNVLHIRELTRLRNIHDNITYMMKLLLQKKDSFYEMTPAKKVRSVTRYLEDFIEELPLFLLHLEKDTGALDDKLEWREFKCFFKIGTSKVSGVLQKLVSHQDTLQDVLIQLCELIQRDAFTQSLYSLGLLHETSKVTIQSENAQRNPSSVSSSPKHYHQEYTLNLVESLCVPPSSSNSTLSKLCLQLLKNGTGTDMEFEIIVSNSSSTESADDDQGEQASSPVECETCVIEAHRVIVAARCDWFRRALLSGMREAIDKKITVHDTNPIIFRVFLEYLYSGRIQQNTLSAEQLAELLVLSDRYEVDSLKQVCEYCLQSSIDEDSVLYFLSLADQSNARILRNACLTYISQHNDITGSDIFLELPFALQAEIFKFIWMQPSPKKSTTTDLLLLSPGSPSPDCSPSDIHKISLIGRQGEVSNSEGNEEDLFKPHGTRMSNCIAQLRDVVGNMVSYDNLVQVVLAADYDVCRALNYIYTTLDELQ